MTADVYTERSVLLAEIGRILFDLPMRLDLIRGALAEVADADIEELGQLRAQLLDDLKAPAVGGICRRAAAGGVRGDVLVAMLLAVLLVGVALGVAVSSW